MEEASESLSKFIALTLPHPQCKQEAIIFINFTILDLFFLVELLAPFIFPLFLSAMERKRGKINGTSSGKKKAIITLIYAKDLFLF